MCAHNGVPTINAQTPSNDLILDMFAPYYSASFCVRDSFVPDRERHHRLKLRADEEVVLHRGMWRLCCLRALLLLPMEKLQDVGSCELAHDQRVAGSFYTFPESCVADDEMESSVWNRIGDLKSGE